MRPKKFAYLNSRLLTTHVAIYITASDARNCGWARPRKKCDRNLAMRGRKRTKPGHSSPGGAASTGPSARDRRTCAVRSSVRSHRIVRSQPSEPRRHHCRPEARVDRLRRLSAASAGRLPAPVVAGQRMWLMPEAPYHSRRARQRARDGALSRARALRPRTAARLTPAGAPPSERGDGRCAAFSRLHPLRCRRQPRQQHC